MVFAPVYFNYDAIKRRKTQDVVVLLALRAAPWPPAELGETAGAAAIYQPPSHVSVSKLPHPLICSTVGRRQSRGGGSTCSVSCFSRTRAWSTLLRETSARAASRSRASPERSGEFTGGLPNWFRPSVIRSFARFRSYSSHFMTKAARWGAQRLMTIAEHSILSNVNHGACLPPSWMTVYELTRAPDEPLVVWLENGTIHPEMEHRDLPRTVRCRLLASFTGKRKLAFFGKAIRFHSKRRTAAPSGRSAVSATADRS